MGIYIGAEVSIVGSIEEGRVGSVEEGRVG